MPRQSRDLANLLAFITLLVATGCGAERPASHETPALAISDDLPQLSPAETIDSAFGGFFVQHSEIAIGPDGRLVAPTPNGLAPMVSKPHGGAGAGFGVTGEGPGEFRLPLVYGVSLTRIIVFDRATQRLSEWGTDGRLISERPVRAPMTPNVAPLVGRGWLLPEPTRDGLRLLVLDSTTGRLSEVIPPQDSFLAAHWRDSRAVTANLPGVGTWPGGFVIAQRMTYEMAFYDRDGVLQGVVQPEKGPNLLGAREVASLEADLAAVGRHLSPARRRDLLAQAQPWIRQRIRMDSEGRTWALAQRGDTPFFDVFAGPRYLGRVNLACPSMGSRWDLNGRWLAVVCAPSDPRSDSESEVRTFHIRG
jgi:hypothetical protein